VRRRERRTSTRGVASVAAAASPRGAFTASRYRRAYPRSHQARHFVDRRPTWGATATCGSTIGGGGRAEARDRCYPQNFSAVHRPCTAIGQVEGGLSPKVVALSTGTGPLVHRDSTGSADAPQIVPSFIHSRGRPFVDVRRPPRLASVPSMRSSGRGWRQQGEGERRSKP
jgi:hypothetical protein